MPTSQRGGGGSIKAGGAPRSTCPVPFVVPQGQVWRECVSGGRVCGMVHKRGTSSPTAHRSTPSRTTGGGGVLTGGKPSEMHLQRGFKGVAILGNGFNAFL